jgi:hypothetical protein
LSHRNPKIIFLNTEI